MVPSGVGKGRGCDPDGRKPIINVCTGSYSIFFQCLVKFQVNTPSCVGFAKGENGFLKDTKWTGEQLGPAAPGLGSLWPLPLSQRTRVVQCKQQCPGFESERLDQGSRGRQVVGSSWD